MDMLERELEQLVADASPMLIDSRFLGAWAYDTVELERLVTADELHIFDGECWVHDECRPILARRIA